MMQSIPARLKQIETAMRCLEQAIQILYQAQGKLHPVLFEKPISDPIAIGWKLDKDIEAEMNKKEIERHRKDMVGEAQRVKKNNDKLKGVWKDEKY
jgi:hypothetical protein